MNMQTVTIDDNFLGLLKDININAKLAYNAIEEGNIHDAFSILDDISTICKMVSDLAVSPPINTEGE